MPDTAMPSGEKALEKTLEKAAQLRRTALDYHQFPVPGKLSVQPTKPMANQHDLALAYSPGVAAPCEEIVREPGTAFRYTARANLVAVVRHGGAGAGRHWPAGGQTGDGGQGRPVQKVCRSRCF